MANSAIGIGQPIARAAALRRADGGLTGGWVLGVTVHAMPVDLLHGLPSDLLWQASSDALVLVDAAGVVVLTNPLFDRLFGYEGGVLVGQSIELVVPEDRQTQHVGHRQRYETTPAQRPMGGGVTSELLGRRADGTTFPVDISLSRLEVGTGPLTLAAVRDMTEQRHADGEVAEANRRRALAEDHDRIARDLHDKVIQLLFATGLDLQSLHGQTGDEELRRRLSGAVDEIDRVIHTIRDTIFDLSRSPQDKSLRDRVVEIAGAMTPMLGFEPTLRFQGQVDLVPDEAVEHIEAVVREALSNVARHAKASTVTVSLVVDETSAQASVEVVDDGRGIGGRPIRRSGLANLADRARALAGTFELTSSAPSGTVVRWSVPVSLPPGVDQ